MSWMRKTLPCAPFLGFHCYISFLGLKYSRDQLIQTKVVTMFPWFVRNLTTISIVCIAEFWLNLWMSWYLGFMDIGSWVHHYLFLNYNNDLALIFMAFRTLPVAHLIQAWCVLFRFNCKSEYGISLCASFDGVVNPICSLIGNKHFYDNSTESKLLTVLWGEIYWSMDLTFLFIWKEYQILSMD